VTKNWFTFSFKTPIDQNKHFQCFWWSNTWTKTFPKLREQQIPLERDNRHVWACGIYWVIQNIDGIVTRGNYLRSFFRRSSCWLVSIFTEKEGRREIARACGRNYQGDLVCLHLLRFAISIHGWIFSEARGRGIPSNIEQGIAPLNWFIEIVLTL